MKLHLLLLFSLLLLSGCSTAPLLRALSKDTATVNMRVTTIYGNVSLQRANPGTNSVTTIAPDGTITIKRQ
jgi:hypothetical protein